MPLDDSQLEVDSPQPRQLASTWLLCECEVPAKSGYIKSHCRNCGRRLVKPRGKKKNG